MQRKPKVTHITTNPQPKKLGVFLYKNSLQNKLFSINLVGLGKCMWDETLNCVRPFIHLPSYTMMVGRNSSVMGRHLTVGVDLKQGYGWRRESPRSNVCRVQWLQKATVEGNLGEARCVHQKATVLSGYF